ncbi:IS481 family transposase [Agrococcus terreus]|uniref:IS481 family transposase n=1 Tax=Agrococcus terreus TaxID=574649 RepID=UPI00385072CA
MGHASVALPPATRIKIARLVVEQGWPIRRVAERFQCSPATVSRWSRRFAAGEAMEARSSRPRRSPMRTPVRLERRIIALRFTRRWGPHRIGFHLRIPRSTVERVLARHRMPLLTHLDQATGLPARRVAPVRYEAAAPGLLVHVDIKKLGRIPDGGGWRAHGRGSAADRAAGVRRDREKRAGAAASRGYAFVHHAVDDHSRLAYSEILADERKETASGFWSRARDFFQQAGFEVASVMTDNGACYRSHAFAAALGPHVRHRHTRPCRPQTNGKVERFNRTLMTEWAYATSYSSDEARAATYDAWLHAYNHHRPHTALDGHTPAQRVHNVTGNYS